MLRLLALLLTTSLLFCVKAPREKILSLVGGEWLAKSVYTAAELDIASHLQQGPKNIEELALLTKSNTENLYRLMRLLSSVGVFHEDENRIFSNTATSELLAKDHPQSLRSLTLFYSQEMSKSFDHLTHCIKEGKPAFDLAFHQPVFTYFRHHPQASCSFNAAMKEKSQAVIASCLEVFDFGQFRSVYDIGGGMGHFVAALLEAYPTMHGTLYELPDVISSSRSSLRHLEPRCSLVPGDFFQTIPKNGDVYLLKSVLHDWSDEKALKILRNCHDAMKNNAKLVIVEPVMRSPNQKDRAKLMDVFMMAVTGGKERSEQEFNNILSQAGFTIESITATETEFYVIEACKKEAISSNALTKRSTSSNEL